MITTALMLALAALNGQASTSIQTQEETQLVRYDDLDLGSPSDRLKLDRRIGRAVRHVCDEPGPPTIERQQRIDACAIAARRNAQREVERALASAAASSHSEPSTSRQTRS